MMISRFGRIRPADVARAMELDEAALWALSTRIEQRYFPERLACIGRKMRPLDVPKPWFMKRLRRLHRWMQRVGVSHPSAYGGVKGKSCFTHAAKHLGNTYLWTRDVSNCYPSVAPLSLYSALRRLGFRCDTARILTRILTVRGRVPQGAPTSADAINLFLWSYDHKLATVAGLNRICFGRLSDDTVISGKNERAGHSLANLAEDELRDRGLEVNARKRSEVGFQRNSGAQHVHNILVNNKNGTRIAAKHCESARKLADEYVAACRSVQSSSFVAIAYKRSRLVGSIHYQRQAKYSQASHLSQMLRRGDRFIVRKLQEMRICADKGRWWLASKASNEPQRIADTMRLREMGIEPEPRPRREPTAAPQDSQIASLAKQSA
jgi:hypothetical protein